MFNILFKFFWQQVLYTYLQKIIRQNNLDSTGSATLNLPAYRGVVYTLYSVQFINQAEICLSLPKKKDKDRRKDKGRAIFCGGGGGEESIYKFPCRACCFALADLNYTRVMNCSR